MGLTYHHIDKKAGGITITPERFENDLVMLKNSGFNIISLRYLIDSMDGNKRLPENAVVLTFDDGYQSFYRYAYPLLKKHNIAATIFNINSFNKSKNISEDDFYMSVGQMKEMIKSNLIDIQSHTYNSHNLIVKDKEGKTGGDLAFKKYNAKNDKYESDFEYKNRVKMDLDESRKFFKERINYDTDILCFPFGHYNKNLINIADECGFKTYITTVYGNNVENSHSRLILRIRAGDAKLETEKLRENIIKCGNQVNKYKGPK